MYLEIDISINPSLIALRFASLILIVWLPMSEREVNESLMDWSTVWRRWWNRMARLVCIVASLSLCRASSSTEPHTLDSMTPAAITCRTRRVRPSTSVGPLHRWWQPLPVLRRIPSIRCDVAWWCSRDWRNLRCSTRTQPTVGWSLPSRRACPPFKGAFSNIIRGTGGALVLAIYDEFKKYV